MAISDEDIFNWFLANPNADDATIASTMDQFDLTPEDIARATGSDISDVQSRYDAVTGSTEDRTQTDAATQLPTFTDTVASGTSTTQDDLLSTLAGDSTDTATTTATQLPTFSDTITSGGDTSADDFLAAISSPSDNITAANVGTKSADRATSGGVSSVVEGDDIDTQISQLPEEVAHWARSADQRYMELIDDKTGAVLQRKAVGDFSDLDLLRTGLSFVPGAGQILAGVNIANAVRTGDLTGALIGATGLDPSLANVNTALRVGQAVDSGNTLGALTALAGNKDLQSLIGADTANVGGFTAKDAMAAGNLVQAANTGNYGGVITNLGTLAGSSDAQIAGRAITLITRLENGDTRALNDAISLSNSVTGNKPTTTGTKVADAGDTGEDVTLPGGIQLASLGDGVFRTDVGGSPTYAESKNAGSVTTPFGYSLLSATEADNKPEGSYYDPTANAWFKPDTSLADLAGGSTLQADLDLFTGSQGDLDQIAASTPGTSDDATADFLASIGITNSTQLADSGLSNSDILDLVNADTDTSGGTGDITGGNITDTTGLDTGDVIPTGDDVPELVVTGDKTTNTDTTTIDTITGGDGNDLIVDDKGEVVIKDKKESCPIGTVLNPETGECDAVEDKGEVVIKDKKESCPIGTVLNPETGECDPVDNTITCPPGKVLNDAGTACIDEVIIKDKKDFCPVGTVLNPETGECDPIDEQLTCPTGFHLSADGLSCEPDTKGKLECPEGYEPNDDGTACIPVIEIKDKKCDPGYVYDEDLKMCVPVKDDTCPVGFHKDDSGTCVPDEVKCETGYHLENGVCVPDKKALECPEGYELNDAGTECIPVVVIKDKKCDPGYVYDEDLKQCVPIKDEGCAEGFHLENGICVPDDDEKCKDGYEKVNGVCVPVCKEGYIRNLATGVCEKVETKDCPPGQMKNAEGKCVPIPKTEECKPGFEKVNGVCVPVCQPGYQRVNGVCKKIATDVIPTPTGTYYGPGEKIDPIYATGMDDFDLFATLEELLNENSDKTDKKKDSKKSKEKTKMATGGHLDDLLAEQMTVDDLLKLLR